LFPRSALNDPLCKRDHGIGGGKKRGVFLYTSKLLRIKRLNEENTKEKSWESGLASRGGIRSEREHKESNWNFPKKNPCEGKKGIGRNKTNNKLLGREFQNMTRLPRKTSENAHSI